MSVKEVPVSSREIIDVAANGFGLSYRHICSFEKKFVDFLKLFWVYVKISLLFNCSLRCF